MQTSETYPVTDPVVLADEDEHADTALEERSDVELGGEHHVPRLEEVVAHFNAAGREVD